MHEALSVVRQMAWQVTAEHGACRALTELVGHPDPEHRHFHVSHGASLNG